jgi:outer membrane lipoprotein SlyB
MSLSIESATVSANLTKNHLRAAAERNGEKDSLVCTAEGTADVVGGAVGATVGGGTESESPPMTGALEAGRFLPRARP